MIKIKSGSTHVVTIPGAHTRAVVTEVRPDTGTWMYSLICEDGEHIDGEVVMGGELAVTPDQVARVAFLLEMEYPKS